MELRGGDCTIITHLNATRARPAILHRPARRFWQTVPPGSRADGVKTAATSELVCADEAEASGQGKAIARRFCQRRFVFRLKLGLSRAIEFGLGANGMRLLVGA